MHVPPAKRLRVWQPQRDFVEGQGLLKPPQHRHRPTHVEMHLRAALVVLQRQVEHLLGPIVIAKLGIHQDAVSVSGDEG